MSKFKVGDRVKCIETDKSISVKLGAIYTVEEIKGRYVYIDCGGGFYDYRFELVDEVACIDEKTGQVEYIKAPGGTKHDNDKPDLSLTPRNALEAMARALSYGKGKYGRDNYRNGFASDRLISASLRHIHAWQDGEDNDPESGVHHLGHALATLAMLLSNEADGVLTDTRYRKGKS